MSGFRLLICVDGSRAALAAARYAVATVAAQGGEIRAVSVLENGDTARQVDARGRHQRPAAARLEQSVQAMLHRVTTLGDDREVAVDTAVLRGDPLRAILEDAREWQPDLILVGRTGRSGPGSPMVGSLAMHLIEFTEWPVVVVPEPAE